MGSYSSLSIGNLEIEWSKNYLNDCSDLYSKSDYFENPNDGLEGYYRDARYSRKLIDCKLRLELLGYTERSTRAKFSAAFAGSETPMTYETFCDYIQRMDIYNILKSDTDCCFNYNSAFTNYCLELLKTDSNTSSDFIEEFPEIAESLNNFNGYDILMLFIVNNKFLEENVVWRFDDLIQGGWISDADVNGLFTRYPSFLLITEGSSDTFIISKAIEWIYPDISYFFGFIDMQKNYPFTGVGNLYNFYQGIAKLGISKKIIFIFDNDTAGLKALDKCKRVPQPNLRLMKLPDLEEFQRFQTLGPNGQTEENINNRAVSIELFLDLSGSDEKKPKIRWTSYDEQMGQYQGVLINKDKYTRRFIEAYNMKKTNYSLEKLTILLNKILEEAKNFI